jgi:hypothetical protein
MSFKLRSTRIQSLAVSAGIALTALAVTGAPASAATCNPPKYPGAGYFTDKIRVTNVSCSYGKRFVVRYYTCRTRSGRSLAGRCPSLSGFRCSEVRESIATEIDARVTCRRGTQRIVHTYTQRLDE